jgi:hypothetical protein
LIGFRIEKKYSGRSKDWHDLEWEIRHLTKERDLVISAAAAMAQPESADVFIKREQSLEYSAADLSALLDRITEANKKVVAFQASIRLN